MNKKYIQELLHFLFDEREKIEATGHSRMMDPDLIKTHEFICDQIQGLHRKILEDEYQQFSERLAEVFSKDPNTQVHWNTWKQESRVILRA
jgi:hypothetical protein